MHITLCPPKPPPDACIISIYHTMKVQKYTLVDEVGSGSFSTVYKAIDTETKELCAIKSMREMQRNNEEVVQNEIDLLKKVRHKNIVNYITDFKEKGKWYIVFEYCGKGDLRKFKQRQGRLPELFCKNLAFSMVSTLSLLHQNNIVHRDLKLENILINDTYDFKLADFGFSKDNESEFMMSFCGTPSAMAPEILKREPYDDRCDTWSLGIMLFELVYGKLPFIPSRKYGAGIFGLTNCVLESEPIYDRSIQVSDQCLDFIKLCLKKEKNERPRMSQLATHPWLLNTTSKLGREYIADCMEDRTEITNRMKEVFNGSVQEHVKNLIMRFQLLDTEIRKYIGFFDKYFKEETEIKALVIVMIIKIMKEIYEKSIQINIEGFTFKVPLQSVNTFQSHISNLNEYLASQIPKNFDQKGKVNIEKSIIKFVVNEALSCLKLTEFYPQKNQLILYLSKLPINQFLSSSIHIEYSFQEEGTRNRRRFSESLEGLSEKEILAFVNEHYFDEDIRSHWLIEHEFKIEPRQGFTIEMGQYVSRIIEINLEPEY